eukprot:TRINITY_DN50870_c0_g1_i1.p3 TRINITY_DN50870_c0_g1~~TRINITY_DN50870_c0_g1_i1.p3  ORF type:complete len:131 (+),score=15.81 TRINITY_DN50870_c0_g1_i1:212-604(+)
MLAAFSSSAFRATSACTPLARSFSQTRACFGIEDFKMAKDASPNAGRSWKASELRKKSFEDLHTLWYVLLKERNLLESTKADMRSKGLRIPNPSRFQKVRKSMARIKLVLWEGHLREQQRKRDEYKARVQ